MLGFETEPRTQMKKPTVVAHACDCSTQEVEARLDFRETLSEQNEAKQ